ncbi:hypothetical protein FGL79_09780 [Latilactobacillus curvatus]|uniref:hypothetical protein n=1 Tax=Latilactobacillus curvatus TaxID=28038 RepID=UPI0011BBE71C|nr:hypothetical protein [Latilactobacillus curvatus]QEA50072.1 hypothetical protein FGL79_09780 [Latilactobacillus curvatus]
MQYSFYISPANAFRTNAGFITPDLNVYTNASGRVVYAPNYHSSWFKLKQPASGNNCFLEPELNDLLIGDRITVDLDVTGIAGESQLLVNSYASNGSNITDQGSLIGSEIITESTHHIKLSMYIDNSFSECLNADKILKRVWLNLRVISSIPTQPSVEVVMENVKITVDTSNQSSGYTVYDNALLSSGDMWRAIYDNKALSTSFSNEIYSVTADALKAKKTGFSLTPQGGLMFPLTTNVSPNYVSGFKGIAIQRIPYVSMQPFSGYIEYETDQYFSVKLRAFIVDDAGKIINTSVNALRLKPDNNTGINKQYFYFDTETLYKLNADDEGRLAYFDVEVGDYNSGTTPDFNIALHSIMVHQDQTTQTHKYVSATVPKGSEA